MFDSVRKHQRILQAVLLLLIFPAFAFFGIAGYENMFSGKERGVAEVGGTTITRREFDDAYRRELDRLQQQYGGQVDPKMLDTPFTRAQVLDGLVTQQALHTESNRKRLRVSDEQLRREIVSIPGLSNPDGSFNMQAYRAALSQQNLTEPMFEAQLRGDLARRALPESVARSAFVPATIADRMIGLLEESREVREQVFKPADFAGKVQPTDEDLRKYYEANGARYEVPESVKAEFLVLSPDAISSQVVPDPAQVKSYYEQNRKRFVTEEERRASHILIKPEGDPAAARARLEALRKKIADGADFAALARAESQDRGSAANGGDVGMLPRELFPKAFGDAAFSLKQGEVSDVVQTEDGLHLIRVTEIRPGKERTFDEVRPEIESDLRKQEASKLYSTYAEQFADLVFTQPDSLQPAADKFKLKLQSAEEVSRAGSAKLPPGSPVGNPKVVAELFKDEAIKNRRNTQAVDIGNSTLVSARVVEHRPAVRRPFDAVKDEVREGFVNDQARRLAREAGEARLKELQAGAEPKGFSDGRLVSRSSPGTTPPAAVDALFHGTPAKLPLFVGADLGGGGYGVYQLVRVQPADPAVIAKKREQLVPQLGQAASQLDVGTYLDSLLARSDVQRHPDRLTDKSDTR